MRSPVATASVSRPWLVLAAITGLSAAACGPSVATVGSSTVRSPPPGQIAGTYGPAGQTFTVRLAQPIDTLSSLRNGAFTAQLVNPLLDQRGQVLAPQGATVHGHVVSLGSVESPRVRFQFDSVDTVFGGAPLQAALRSAEYRKYPGPVIFVPNAGYSYGYYGWADGWYGWGPIGGGPFYNDAYVPYRPHEVHLPEGARMDLVLTRPLLPSGAAVITSGSAR